jgi:hypothetical protein
MRSRIFRCLATGLALTLAGCSHLVASSAIAAAEARWKSRGIQDYHYKIEISDLAPFTPCSPGRVIDVEVRDGQTVKFGSCAAEHELAQAYGSVPRMFATIRKSRSDRPPRYLVKFNASLGYPESIDANYSRTMTDYSIGYYIEEFGPLP